MPGVLPAGVDWPTLALALGLRLPSRALPVRAWCPLCQQPNFHVTESTTGDIECDCGHCEFHGGAVALAQALWDTDAEAARDRLQREVRLRLPATPPSTLDQLWRQAQAALATDTPRAIRDLREHYGLLQHRGGSEEATTALLGYARRSVLEKRGGLRTRSRADCALVLPAWTTPRQLAGLHVVTVAGELEPPDFLAAGSSEAGLVGLDVALASPLFEGTLVDCEHPLLACRLHCVQYRYREAAAPVVASWWGPEHRTRLAWQHLRDYALIHWSARLSWRVLATALETGGKIALAGPQEPSWSAWRRYTRHAEPLELLRSVQERARSWPGTLYWWMRRHSLASLRRLQADLRTAGVSLDAITAQLQGPPRLTWRRCARPPVTGNHASYRLPYSKIRILQTAGAWIAVENDRATDCWTALNGILHLPWCFLRDGAVWYRGHFQQGGCIYPFEGPATEVEEQTGLWLRRLACLHGLDLLLCQRLKPRLFEIAQGFQMTRTTTLAELPPFDPTPRGGGRRNLAFQERPPQAEPDEPAPSQ